MAGGSFRGLFDPLGNPGALAAELAATSGKPANGVQPNSTPLGAETGAPPNTRIFSITVAPSTTGPTMVVPGERASRVAVFIAPGVGFSIYIGDAGVSPANGLRLTPLIPIDIPIKGLQEIYAVTDAPVSLRLEVQIAPLLIGDRERRI